MEQRRLRSQPRLNLLAFCKVYSLYQYAAEAHSTVTYPATPAKALETRRANLLESEAPR